MGDPDFRSNEKVLLRSDGVNVKSVPFEATLTDRRIVLVDRARNVLPQKDIHLSAIRQIATGENAIRDPTLTVYVAANNNETRQMVLTFSRDSGGNRAKERDEWKKFLEYYIPRAPPASVPPAPEPAASYRNDAAIPPQKRFTDTVPARMPARETPPAAPAAPESFFCNRCGNRVSKDSAFCNKCGSPIVPPAPSPYVAPAPAGAYTPAPLPRTPAPGARVPEEAPPAVDAIRISDTPVRPPVRMADTRNQGIPAPRRPAEPEPSKKPKKQGFIPSLFSSKSRSASKRNDSLAPAEPAPEKPRRRGGSGTAKKVILSAVVLVIIIAVIAAGAVFVYPMISSGGLLTLPSGESSSGGSSSSGSVTPTTTPQGQTTPSVQTSWTPIAVETTAAVIPSAGVQVHISYLGGFKGSYGLPSALQSIQASGDRVYLVENATGTVQAVIEKRDSSTKHDLLVEIYKDGKLLTKGSTNAAYGKVTLEVDTKTGVAKTPITSASVGTVATTAAAAAQKTTAPAANTTAKAS
jgi:hypothetical protein